MKDTFHTLRTTLLRILALALIAAAVYGTYTRYLVYTQLRSVYPAGTVIAGVDAGGLHLGEVVDRLKQAYLDVPVALKIQGTTVHIAPDALQFTLDFGTMMSAAEVERTRQAEWPSFWDFLWDHPRPPFTIPLSASVSDEAIRTYLQDQISPRYNQSPIPAAAIAGTVDFTVSQPGTSLEIDSAVPKVAAALRSLNSREIEITAQSVPAPRPSLDQLSLLLEQSVQRMGFTGILELYLSSPDTAESLSLAYAKGKMATPDIAFTAASTMKIPIMVSVFRRQPDPLPAEIDNMFTAMIEFSDNDMSDKLLETIDQNLGPLKLTDDLQMLGFQNTFLAGYYYPGAPLLQRYETPANLRTDLNTGPDIYNQTTPGEVGRLLEAIYTCAENDHGLLETTFPGQITQSKCKQMIGYLLKNKNGVLLEAGLPEGTRIAHKHGWTTESDGLIHTISDAGIIYSPGGSYILAIYIQDQDQLLFERMNFMIALLSQTVYNFYNLP